PDRTARGRCPADSARTTGRRGTGPTRAAGPVCSVPSGYSCRAGCPARPNSWLLHPSGSALLDGVPVPVRAPLDVGHHPVEHVEREAARLVRHGDRVHLGPNVGAHPEQPAGTEVCPSLVRAVELARLSLVTSGEPRLRVDVLGLGRARMVARARTATLDALRSGAALGVFLEQVPPVVAGRERARRLGDEAVERALARLGRPDRLEVGRRGWSGLGFG